MSFLCNQVTQLADLHSKAGHKTEYLPIDSSPGALCGHHPCYCLPSRDTASGSVDVKHVYNPGEVKNKQDIVEGWTQQGRLPHNDTSGDIWHLLLWLLSPSSSTYYPEKITQLKREAKWSHQPGMLFSDNQLVYSSFSNKKCCWTSWITSLASLSSREFQS